MAATAADQPIRILHLSDFHFSNRRKWDTDRVFLGLAAVIRGFQAQGLAPDLVAITGDIAKTGKPEDYQEAEKWLDGCLLPALGEGFPREHLLMVPGNHDADREAVKFVAQAVQAKLLIQGDQAAVADLLADPEERRPLLRRHDAYLEFVAKYRPANTGPAVPWWSDVFPIRGLNVHVAGLCSSWMSWSDQERGRLLVSRWQADQVLKDASAADWKIALVHHPWSFLADFDAHHMEKRMHHDCHMVFRGHLHLQQIRAILYPDDVCLELAAGSCYDGSEYPNTFQLVELDRQGETPRVHFWLWTGIEWVEDRNAYAEAADGVACFSWGVYRRKPGIEGAKKSIA
ncbi:MAG: metallophosphoesterase family protein [Thermoguttaceae bacterium]